MLWTPGQGTRPTGVGVGNMQAARPHAAHRKFQSVCEISGLVIDFMRTALGSPRIERSQQFVNAGLGQAGRLIRGAVVNPDAAIFKVDCAIREDNPAMEAFGLVVGLRFEQGSRRAFQHASRVVQIEQQGEQPINAVRSRAVINLEPAFACFEARRSAANAFVLPTIVPRPDEALVSAPVDQVRRFAVPNRRTAEPAIVRTMQRAVAAVDSLRKQADVLVLWREDDAEPFNGLKVPR